MLLMLFLLMLSPPQSGGYSTLQWIELQQRTDRIIAAQEATAQRAREAELPRAIDALIRELQAAKSTASKGQRKRIKKAYGRVMDALPDERK